MNFLPLAAQAATSDRRLGGEATDNAIQFKKDPNNMQPKIHTTANHRPNTGPTGADLDETLGHLGRAHTALSGMRSLVHVHSTRHTLTVSEDSVQYLLEKRDEVLAAVDAALLGYADAVDPSGTLHSMVASAINARPTPELVPVDDEQVYGIRHMRRLPDGQLVEVARYS